MARRRTVAWWIVLVVIGGSTAPVSEGRAQETSSSSDTTSSAADAPDVGTSEASDSPAPPPSDPDARLRRAERAFQRAQFGRLLELLRPLLTPKPVFEDADKRIRSRELLGVGYYFAAQQSPEPDRRDKLLEAARTQFWELLRERPDYSLDPLIFPANVVELFESVREHHAEQLAEIRRRRQSGGNDSKAAGETLYIERRIEQNLFALNFFPFGVGQFQNGSPLKGSLFAGGQIAALGLQTASWVVVEGLRNANGRFNVGPNRSGGDFARARRWRNIQYAAIGAFAGVYLWSLIDALVGYKPRRVHIETLNEPPPELGSDESSSIGKPPSIRIGWGYVHIRW